MQTIIWLLVYTVPGLRRMYSCNNHYLINIQKPHYVCYQSAGIFHGTQIWNNDNNKNV